MNDYKPNAVTVEINLPDSCPGIGRTLKFSREQFHEVLGWHIYEGLPENDIGGRYRNLLGYYREKFSGRISPEPLPPEQMPDPIMDEQLLDLEMKVATIFLLDLMRISPMK